MPHRLRRSASSLLPAGDIQREAATLRHLPYLGVVLEQDLAGQRRFQVLFQELAEPALSKHEVQVHALLGCASTAVA